MWIELLYSCEDSTSDGERMIAARAVHAQCQWLTLHVCWLQIQGLPTMVFVSTDPAKPALRTEGLLPAKTIKEIVANELS